ARLDPVNIGGHLHIAVLTILLGFLLHVSTVDFAIIFVMIAIVFVAEMFNTVFERSIDLFSPAYPPLAKLAKDVAAGAVLLSAIFAVVIGLLIFGPRLLALIR